MAIIIIIYVTQPSCFEAQAEIYNEIMRETNNTNYNLLRKYLEQYPVIKPSGIHSYVCLIQIKCVCNNLYYCILCTYNSATTFAT